MEDLSFPNEAEVKADYERELAAEFQENRDLFTNCLTAPMDAHFEKSKLPNGVLHCFQISLCRTLRHYRTVIELCERGEAAIAGSVARSMFENSIALQFVHREQFRAKHFEKCASAAGYIKKMIENSDQIKRAKMFLLYAGLRQHDFVLKNEARGTMTSDLIRLKDSLNEDVPLDELIQEWGKAEINTMKKANTCSGLSIGDLCSLLGEEWRLWYMMIYSDLSANTHFSDAWNYTDESADGSQISSKWHGEPAVTKQILGLAKTLCMVTIGCIHKAVGYHDTFE